MPAPFLTPLPLVARAWLSLLRDIRSEDNHSAGSRRNDNHRAGLRGGVGS